MIELMYMASSSKCFLDILWLLLTYYNSIVAKWSFLVNHKKTLHWAGLFLKKHSNYFLASFFASAAGAAGLVAAGLASSFLAGAGACCATADNANADATIASNAFMLFPFESLNLHLLRCSLYNAVETTLVDEFGKTAYLITKLDASDSEYSLGKSCACGGGGLGSAGMRSLTTMPALPKAD